MELREVLITISGLETGDTYLSKSYIHSDYDGDGKDELYETPVYYVFIEGNTDDGYLGEKAWTALRFMPHWNNPKKPYPGKKQGFFNTGLADPLPKTAVTEFVRENTEGRGRQGGIKITGGHFIHRGPRTLSHIGWKASGCVEIIGDFEEFKKNIRDFSGCDPEMAVDDAMITIIKERKLFVTVEKAIRPNFLKLIHKPK